MLNNSSDCFHSTVHISKHHDIVLKKAYNINNSLQLMLTAVSLKVHLNFQETKSLILRL